MILRKLSFRQFYITKKLELQGSFVDKGSGSGIFPDQDQDPGDPKRPDPDPQHCSENYPGGTTSARDVDASPHQ